jgi:hypothetical protein
MKYLCVCILHGKAIDGQVLMTSHHLYEARLIMNKLAEIIIIVVGSSA